MTRTANQPGRVHDELAFVLHRHDWSESSLILDVFSRTQGRMAVVAKGAKRPTSQFRAVLLPLQPLRLTWGGQAEVRSLKAAAWQGGQLMPQGEPLLAGYYLNELLLKLLAREDPHPWLFDGYAQAVAALAHGAPQAAVLRAFELLLLRALGLLPALDQEGASLAGLDSQARYHLQAEQGLLLTDDAAAINGAQWLALHHALQSSAPLLSLCPECQDDKNGVLRKQLRQLLHYHSGVRVFQTRQLLADVQRLANSTAVLHPSTS